MIVSQPALICLESVFQRLIGRSSASGTDPGAIQVASLPQDVIPIAARELGAPERAHSPRLERPSSIDGELALDAPLSAAERRARAAALKGLAFSRQRQFDAARSAFAVAARLDPRLDLTRTPTFWKLERAAHEAAIDAYLDADRTDDAAVLRARVRSTYRPKALRPSPAPIPTT
jgi:hypothetical protein